jgi:hypothetical protein
MLRIAPRGDARARPCGTQADIAELVAGDTPAACRAVALACPGLVPFVAAALCELAEHCARMPWRGAWHIGHPTLTLCVACTACRMAGALVR